MRKEEKHVRIIAINDNVDCLDGATDMDDFIPISALSSTISSSGIWISTPRSAIRNYTADIREGVAVEYVSCEPSEAMKELFPEQYGEGEDSFEEEETEQA